MGIVLSIATIIIDKTIWIARKAKLMYEIILVPIRQIMLCPKRNYPRWIENWMRLLQGWLLKEECPHRNKNKLAIRYFIAVV